MTSDASTGPKEHLSLKWGTMKSWKFDSDAADAIFTKYGHLLLSSSAMAQDMTPEHKAFVCELIDVIDGPIDNDWTGEVMTKDEAKKYIMEYRS